jgi:hypothetical protein
LELASQRKIISQRKLVKYLKDDNIVVSVGSVCRILVRKVTGAPRVRRTHLVHVPDDVRVQILAVQVETLGREGFRYLCKDAREAFQYLEKSKLDYILKAYRKHYSGFPKFLLRTKGGVCG